MGFTVFISGVFLSLVLNTMVVWAKPVFNKPSLRRGATLFMNYCSGCHSIKYLSYQQLAQEIGQDVIVNDWILTQASLNAPLRVALPPEDAKQWFGIVPPDLSLITREKGPDWLYRYLKGFYGDESRPFGSNNHMVMDVAMPNILESLNQEATPAQIDGYVLDLINFLSYVAEPIKQIRYRIGFFVLGYLLILFLLALALKTVYWRKIRIK